mgnify:CR=1 FL=1
MSRKRDKQLLEDLAFYSISARNTMKKGLDRTFLNYGIRQEDMQIIEDACHAEDIDVSWFKEHILKAYNEQRINEQLDERHLRSLIIKALRRLP